MLIFFISRFSVRFKLIIKFKKFLAFTIVKTGLIENKYFDFRARTKRNTYKSYQTHCHPLYNARRNGCPLPWWTSLSALFVNFRFNKLLFCFWFVYWGNFGLFAVMTEKYFSGHLVVKNFFLIFFSK